jgi:hypothetical protein
MTDKMKSVSAVHLPLKGVRVHWIIWSNKVRNFFLMGWYYTEHNSNNGEKKNRNP